MLSMRNAAVQDGCTALMIACKDSHRKIIQLLLLHKDIQLNAQDKVGQPSLPLLEISNAPSP